jgi:excisionase family DNA binding protein
MCLPMPVFPMELQRLIDINELSRRLSVPKGTLYNWVYLRRIPFIKAGRSLRFDAEEVIHSLPHSPTMGGDRQAVEGIKR